MLLSIVVDSSPSDLHLLLLRIPGVRSKLEAFSVT